MAITLLNPTLASVSSASPSVTLTGYTPALGDVVFVFVASNAGGPGTFTPSGWIRWQSTGYRVASDANHALCSYHHITAGEVSGGTNSWTLTGLYDATCTGSIMGVAIRGLDTSVLTADIPLRASAFDSANVATHSAPGIAATGMLADCVALRYITGDGVDTYGSVTGHTQLLVTSSPNSAALYQQNALTVAGVAVASASVSTTISPTNEYASITLALQPAAISPTGTIAAILQKATASLVGVMQPSGVLVASLTKLTALIGSLQSQQGTVAAALRAAIANLSGTHAQSGQIAALLKLATMAAAGGQTQAGTMAPALQKVAFAGAGAQPFSGTSAVTLQPLTAVAAGDQSTLMSGTLAPLLKPLTAAIIGGHAQSGQLPASLRPLTFSALSERYFDDADWLWDPIPASPVLDANSAAMVTSLASTSGGSMRIANMYDYGATLIPASAITGATPRYTVSLDNYPDWGDPLGSDTVPIPAGTIIPPGSDGHVAIADPINGKVYSFWQLRFSAGVWSAAFAGVAPLHGDGIETAGSSTATNLSRYAGVIRAAEIAAGHIPHALVFSTNMAAPTVYRYPAQKTDGNNSAGVAVPIPEGARIQLDPSINVAAIAGITAGEVAVAKALQTYGAYVCDKGGARAGFIFEHINGTSPGSTYIAAGLEWDYFDMSHIPWSNLRVLKVWDGSEGISGTIAAILRYATASLTGVMQPSGTLATSMQRLLAQVGSLQSQQGAMASTLRTALFAAAGGQTQAGTVSAVLQRMAFAGTGAQSFSGTSAVTLRPAAVAAAGGQTQAGIAASALRPLVANLAGAMQPAGTIASALQRALIAAIGGQTQSGVFAAALLKPTAAVLGVMMPSGTIATVLVVPTFSAAGVHGQSGQLSVSLLPMRAALSGVMLPTGTIGAVLRPAATQLLGTTGTGAAVTAALTRLAFAGAGAQPFTGTAGAGLQPVMFTGVGAQTITATMAAELTRALFTGSAGQTGTGQAAVILQPLTAAALGAQTVQGQLAAELTPLLFAGAGSQVTPGGQLGAALMPMLCTAAGAQQITGVMAAVLRALLFDAAGLAPVQGQLSAQLQPLLMAVVAVAVSSAPTPADRTYLVPVELRAYLIAAEHRIHAIAGEVRGYEVGAEHRIHTVPAEHRTI